MRSAFVVSQVALSVVVLVGAGLLVRSFRSLMQVQPGFDSHNLLTMEYRLPKNTYTTPAQQWDFHRRMLEEVQHVPGVTSAAIVQALPFSGNGGSLPFWAASASPPAPGHETTAQTNLVTPEYFATMGLALLSGRNFTDADRADAPTVIVVSQLVAAKTWPGQDPIGKQLHFPGTSISAGRQTGPTQATVIGVVPETKHTGLRQDPEPQIYFAYSQLTGIFGTLVVKTAADPMSLSDAVRRAVWRIDKDQPVWKVRTLDSLIHRDMAADRFLVVLMSLFGLLALALTSVGTYGLISYSVAQRTQEIGVRMALGASRTHILLLVLQRAIRLIAIGVAVGVLASLATTRLSRALLFNVSTVDPVAFGAAFLIMAVVAIAATYTPAQRATRVDPLVALRHQ
jgi:putative ABC transport system permease protein